MAAQLLQHRLRGVDDFAIGSAGTDAIAGDPMTALARQYVLRSTGCARQHRARRLAPPLLDRADLVLTMTEDVRRDVAEMERARSHRIFTLVGFTQSAGARSNGSEDILDPFGLGPAAYHHAGGRIAAAVGRLARTLLAAR